MDSERFAQLSRAVAARFDRRGALGAFSAAALAIAGVEMATPEAEALGGFCRIATAKCTRGRQCCSGQCQNGACTCKPRGGQCFQAGINCCSGRCRRGKCR